MNTSALVPAFLGRRSRFPGSPYLNKLLLLCPLIQPLVYSCAPVREPGQPNVILILTDDQDYGDMAAHGNPYNSYEGWFADVFSNWETRSYVRLGETETGDADGTPAVNEDAEETPAWNRSQVRNGAQLNGYWDIDVRSAGEYSIELRRWPREADLEICAGLPASAMPIPGGKPFGPGKALKITEASIKIGNREGSQKVGPGDKSIIFRMNLAEVKTRLYTRFTNGTDISMGASYVYLNKLNR